MKITPNHQNSNQLLADGLNPSAATGQNGYYGSSDLAQKVQAIVDSDIIEPELDKSSIRTAAFTSGRQGESGIRETAARRFGAVNSQHVEEVHGVLELLEHSISGAYKHVKEISTGMNPARRYIRSQTNGTPWTKADRVKFWFFLLVSGLLLAIGINTIATVLRSSGIPAFENPVTAYLFSGIPIALATCLKGLASFIEDDSRRSKYVVGVWVVGFLFGVTWAYLFAGTFKGLTQTTAELVNSLTETGGSGDSPASNVYFIFVAILSETFLSAGCLLTSQAISDKHQMEELVDSPAYLKQQKDLDRWSKIHHDYVQLRGLLTGKLQAIEDKSRAHVEQAVSFYRAALKAASDNQRLDDFLGS